MFQADHREATSLVIPAKGGTYEHRIGEDGTTEFMDPGFRRDDSGVGAGVRAVQPGAPCRSPPLRP